MKTITIDGEEFYLLPKPKTLKKKNSMSKIQELADTVYYEMENYNQITIDLISEAESLIQSEYTSEQIDALYYDISILLEVINPIFKNDIYILTGIQEILYKITMKEEL